MECPHALDLHDSPVTCLAYYADCPSDLIGALTLVGCKQRKKGLSERVSCRSPPHDIFLGSSLVV